MNQLDLFRPEPHWMELLEQRVECTPESEGHPVWEFGAMLVSLGAGLGGMHRDSGAWEWARNLHYSWHGRMRRQSLARKVLADADSVAA